MIAGLDIGASFHVLYSPVSKRYFRIPAEDQGKLLSILSKDNIKVVFLEPTGVWSIPVIENLYAAGIDVYLVHTTRFRRFAASQSNNKEDYKDAWLLQKYGEMYLNRKGELTAFKVNELYIESRKMWQLWKEREALKKMEKAEENRLREQIYLNNIQMARKTRKALLRYALDSDDPDIQNRASRILSYESQIRKLENRMKELVNELPHMKRMIELLMSIPEVGFLTAYFTSMQVIDIKRFTKRSFRAFLGVGKKREQSGIRTDRFSRLKSHKTFRALLWMVAIRLIGKGHVEWQRYYTWQLSRVSVPRKAIWRVISKLVNILYGVLRKGEKYDRRYLLDIVDDRLYEIAKEILKGKTKKKYYKLRDKMTCLEKEAGVG